MLEPPDCVGFIPDSSEAFEAACVMSGRLPLADLTGPFSLRFSSFFPLLWHSILDWM
jgi:hypothetical protein